MFCAQYPSPLGKLLLTCTDRGLSGIYLNREEPVHLLDHPVLLQTAAWLDDYFRGHPQAAEIPLDLEGTEFQKMVWQILLTIPYGEIKSYGAISREMAALMGKKHMSAQAVGQAVGKNPVSILIPCHRVVGTKGQLTGYAGGLENKIRLLRQEGHRIEKDIVL